MGPSQPLVPGRLGAGARRWEAGNGPRRAPRREGSRASKRIEATPHPKRRCGAEQGGMLVGIRGVHRAGTTRRAAASPGPLGAASCGRGSRDRPPKCVARRLDRAVRITGKLQGRRLAANLEGGLPQFRRSEPPSNGRDWPSPTPTVGAFRTAYAKEPRLASSKLAPTWSPEERRRPAREPHLLSRITIRSTFEHAPGTCQVGRG